MGFHTPVPIDKTGDEHVWSRRPVRGFLVVLAVLRIEEVNLAAPLLAPLASRTLAYLYKHRNRHPIHMPVKYIHDGHHSYIRPICRELFPKK